MKKVFLIASLLLATLVSNAQIKEGFVNYEMKIDGLPPEAAAMMGDMETKMYFKGDKSYSEMNSMMYSVKTLSDNKGTLLLMDQMGNKFYVKKTKEEGEKEAKKYKQDIKVTYANDKKTIAGYECSKAIVTIKDKDSKSELKTDVWYSEKLFNIYTINNADAALLFNQIKGMPLEYDINQGEMKIKMSAKEVSNSPVSDSIFNLSTEGYKELKESDLKKAGN